MLEGFEKWKTKQKLSVLCLVFGVYSSVKTAVCISQQILSVLSVRRHGAASKYLTQTFYSMYKTWSLKNDQI